MENKENFINIKINKNGFDEFDNLKKQVH